MHSKRLDLFHLAFRGAAVVSTILLLGGFWGPFYDRLGFDKGFLVWLTLGWLPLLVVMVMAIEWVVLLRERTQRRPVLIDSKFGAISAASALGTWLLMITHFNGI